MPLFGKKDMHSGYIDDLSDNQSMILEQFKDEIQNKYSEIDPRFNDIYLLRFLRANNFKLNKTMKMFYAFIDWRKEMDVDNAIWRYSFPNELPRLKEMYSHGYHNTDRFGRPVYVDRLSLANIDECLKIMDEDMLLRYNIMLYERQLH